MLMFRLQSLSLTLTGAGLMHTLRGAVPSIAPQRTNCRVNGSVVGYFATVNSSHVYQYAHFLNYRDTPIGLLTGGSLWIVSKQAASSLQQFSLSALCLSAHPPQKEKQGLSNNKVIHASSQYRHTYKHTCSSSKTSLPFHLIVK